MSKAIVFTRADDGGTTVLRPVPWARLVKAFRSHSGERTEVDPPQALDRFLRRVVTREEFDALEIDYAESEAEFLERIKAKDVPKDATNISIVDEGVIPTDRTFREALKADLTFDMAKAREIHRDRMRTEMRPLLASLTDEYQDADDEGDQAAKRRIVARKKALRNVTADPAIEAAVDIAALAKVWPMVLGTPK